MLKRALIIFSVLVGGSAAYAAPTTGADLESKYLKNVLCQKAVNEQLSSMGVSHDWAMPSVGDMDGSRRLLSPTKTIGVWVEAHVFMNQEVVLRRITENFVETREFDLNTCKVKQVAQKQNDMLVRQQQLTGEYFSDRDLRGLIKNNQKGVIYIWSPNMPYSYVTLSNKTSGLSNIKAAARAVGADVTVLLDPAASRESALQVVETNPTITPEFTRKVQSVELGLRAMGNHYPVVILYANGKIAKRIYPGVATTEEYLNYIQGQLNELKN